MPRETSTSARRKTPAPPWAGMVAVLLLSVFPVGAGAQGVDSTRTIVIPAPEAGVVYIRSGPPGGVRIRSRHTTRRNSTESVSAGLESIDRTAAVFRPADLARLEALLATQGLDLDLSLVRRGGEDVLVLRSRAGGQAVDTLTSVEAMNLLGSFGGRASPNEVAPADVPPLVTRIERSILESGLFRSLQVNFEFDRSELLSTAEPTLDAVADVLMRFSDLRISVEGHTDAVGPDAYNRRLSEARAEQVRRSLIRRGIAPERVRARGLGEEQPVLPNSTPTGRALNRRVEFVLLNPEAAQRYRYETRPDPQEQIELLRQSIQDGVRGGIDDSLEDNN